MSQQPVHIAVLPDPPYYVALFVSQRRPDDGADYGRMAVAMDELAHQQPGFLGMESVRDASGAGITLAYFRTEADLAAWKQVTAHTEAQRSGRTHWYEDYAVRVAKVERAYTMTTSPQTGLGEQEHPHAR